MAKLEIVTSKRFGQKSVLANASLECVSGTITGIFGRNGCGKSTLLKIIFGTVRGDAVQIKIDDMRVDPSAIIPKQLIAYLPQHNFLPKHLKVRDVIPMYYPDGGSQDRIFYADGISKIANTQTGALSAGEIRYLQLLMVGNLAHPFVLLDEPFSMVDPLYRERIQAYLLALKSTKGIIITDHYFEDVLGITDFNFVLKEGQLLPVNGREDLLRLDYLRG
ncbi:MAG: ABC transporter ATP-binding protein [Flavobacterium sp. BFFFF1]|uniref:ATP-binding cassette domain-containing protein n=1 Tax=Flavobacterium sp. BFFFF1 TaxID=2015557 RepID=UPI000BD08F54|nr:ATP-binding cassette domain-containing protein [Flavobacterium sp. BFFFF1]OYU81378.1 MAG: ABC transporter ATP-binding protein [Flavobacterium sp. BFFFF1]